MKALGNQSQITKTRHLLIRSRTLPEIYSAIVTEDRRKVGQVMDIIGPVMDPHILVKPTPQVLKNPELVEGKELFEMPSRPRRKRKWKKER